MVRQGVAPASIVLAMTVLGILTGAIQILIGFLGIGRLINHPYPVVSGYLSGVGLIIISSQIPKFAGVKAGAGWFETLLNPPLWDWRALAVGGVTVLAMFFSSRLTKICPRPPSPASSPASSTLHAGLAVGDPGISPA